VGYGRRKIRKLQILATGISRIQDIKPSNLGIFLLTSEKVKN